MTRAVIMVGKIGPKFDINSIEITPAVRQVFLGDVDFEFILEDNATDEARWYANGVAVAFTARHPDTPNGIVMNVLKNAVTDTR